MKWTKEHGPAYTILKVSLEPGEEVTAEPGAMMLIRGDVDVKTSSGGFLKGLLRRALGGESFFLNTYRARGPAEVWFVPPLPGDIGVIDLDGEWVVQDMSYLAHYGDVDVSIAWRGLKGLIAEGELFWLKLSGRGRVWVSAYGALEEVEVPAGERIIIDNMHFVAMPADVDYKIRKVGGLKTFFFGGEGFVIEVRGPAKILVQTRILPTLARILAKFLPSRSS